MMPANVQAEQVMPEKPLSQSQKSILLQMLTTINLLIAQEKQFISDSPMPSDDKQTGHRILSEIYNALKEKDLITSMLSLPAIITIYYTIIR